MGYRSTWTWCTNANGQCFLQSSWSHLQAETLSAKALISIFLTPDLLMFMFFPTSHLNLLWHNLRRFPGHWHSSYHLLLGTRGRPPPGHELLWESCREREGPSQASSSPGWTAPAPAAAPDPSKNTSSPATRVLRARRRAFSSTTLPSITRFIGETRL